MTREQLDAIAYADLPEDMQVLIGDFLELEEDDHPAAFLVTLVDVDTLPYVALDERDRGEAHARDMDLSETPPILIADGQFLDGKHRLFQARETGVERLPAIDLSGMVSAHMLRCNGMGEIAVTTTPRP
ncbi:hypothetical protein [Bosea sp. RAC05]|uniref:hypothetical protein n=1 Tax=Bosea sp. RAC05 TaxID=1842539 RepID=UPI00083DDC50|nr:hypothetical protein [Bosea sp. RAC05]AOG03259.1 hypothetical protein BSY19_5389 [Bosea sp. RAC05]